MLDVWPCGAVVSREGSLYHFFILVITWITFYSLKNFFSFAILNPNFWLFLLDELLRAELLYQRVYAFKGSLHMWLHPHGSSPTLGTIFFFFSLWVLLLSQVKIFTFQLQIAYIWALRKLNIFPCLLVIGFFSLWRNICSCPLFIFHLVTCYYLSLHLKGSVLFLANSPGSFEK